jgi:2-polyprenyl-3-methyl-5-hydroxy-6-metoxy-1,4-benzoquinol methylase
MIEYIKVNQEVYDKLAGEYKKKMQDYVISDRKMAAPFINYLKKHFSKVRVLELGPGSGLNLAYFEKEGFETTTIDISREIIRVSQEIAPKTKYLFGDFLAFDFIKSKFEGIFAKAFIHLFPKEDARAVLKKIFDLLVDSGAAFIATTIHNKSEEGFFEKTDYDKKMKRFRKRWLESELLEEITNTGFTIYHKDYCIEPNKKKKWINLIVVKHPS